MIENHKTITILTIIAIIMGLILLLFWAWHFFCLAAYNVTTNENNKYSMLKSYLKKKLHSQHELKQHQQKEINNNNNNQDCQQLKVEKTMFKDFDLKNW